MAEMAPRLYLITPRLAAVGEFARDFEAALDAGDIACVFLRLETIAMGEKKKIVAALTPLAQKHDAALLLEDLLLAARTDTDGVHIQQPGLELDAALAAMKPDKIVGVSGLTSRHEAMVAGESGVDYVMFGGPEDGAAPASDSAIAELTGWWGEIFTLPCVAYAPSLAQVAPLAELGADFIALGDAVWADRRGAAAAVEAAMLALAPSRERIS